MSILGERGRHMRRKTLEWTELDEDRFQFMVIGNTIMNFTFQKIEEYLDQLNTSQVANLYLFIMVYLTILSVTQTTKD